MRPRSLDTASCTDRAAGIAGLSSGPLSTTLSPRDTRKRTGTKGQFFGNGDQGKGLERVESGGMQIISIRMDYMISPYPIGIIDPKVESSKLMLKSIRVGQVGHLPGRTLFRTGVTFEHWAFVYIASGRDESMISVPCRAAAGTSIISTLRAAG
ncbi:hypothetical protein [Paenibacillus apii]|uniref:hypothetical protein n=1 Tax=Paenibacillus apii TaxID=1850370 RepID=UPI0014389DE7|nr:hypothetical protein [Paenibacillus apii]NJJ41862.1 hypothetical protein [Paenibacillus apii]